MNVDETKKLIAVMQAYVDGKEIEWKSTHNEFWYPLDNGSPRWNLISYAYRVKPRKEKRKGYINAYPNDIDDRGWPTKELANVCAGRDRVGEAIEIEYEVEIP